MRTFGLALLLASAVVMPCLAQGSSESRRASLESTARNLAKEYATGNPKPISGAAESGVHDGKHETATSTERTSARAGNKKEKGTMPLFVADPNAKYSHPYYWAPFILIGNWK